MNAQNAHEYLPLIYALANGKTIQMKSRGIWHDATDPTDTVGFTFPPEFYRVKPEPRTFDIIKSRLTGAIYSASEWDGTSPNIWERITVQEVLEARTKQD